MPLQHPQLGKTLGLVPAVGLAINLVVGSGLLIGQPRQDQQTAADHQVDRQTHGWNQAQCFFQLVMLQWHVILAVRIGVCKVHGLNGGGKTTYGFKSVSDYGTTHAAVLWIIAAGDTCREWCRQSA